MFKSSIYYKRTLLLLVITSIVKCLVALFTELGNDEVYYWTYALQPDWNHFDHPPMVGLLIRFFTFNLHWVNTFSLRLGAIVAGAFAAWFVFKAAETLLNERVGWLAVLFYQSAVYTSIIAGLFIMPDSPQMLFWTFAIWKIAEIIKSNTNTANWLLLGLAIGLATLSKVHALYLWAGFGCYILFYQTKWLLNWRLYISFFITALCLLPIVYWNIDNDFITYKFHAERVTHTSLQWDMLLQEIVGEALYQNPVVFILIIVAILAVVRKKIQINNPTKALLFFLSIPMILLFWGVALFNPTLPHWAGPAYIPLYILAGYSISQTSSLFFPWGLRIALSFLMIVLIAGSLLIQFAGFNTGSQAKENFGEYCPTLDMSGWQDFGKEFTALTKADVKAGIMKPSSVILINKWFPGGHIEFYVSRQANLPVIGVGRLQDVHKFAWLNRTRKQIVIGDDAYYIVASNLPFNALQNLQQHFTSVDKPIEFTQIRSGRVVRYFWVYRLHNCKKIFSPLLP